MCMWTQRDDLQGFLLCGLFSIFKILYEWPVLFTSSNVYSNYVFHVGKGQNIYKEGLGGKWHVLPKNDLGLPILERHCFHFASFLVSPQKASLYVCVLAFFCMCQSISYLLISLQKEINTQLLTQGYCKVKEIDLFYALAVPMVLVTLPLPVIIP